MGRLTNIVKIKGDWKEVRNDCRFTVGKSPLDTEPSDDFKRRILVAEHSPIRAIYIKWTWLKMKHWVTVHWVRHKWEKYVRTQRTDRTGSDIPRDEHLQGELQDFEGEGNIQHLIDTERKRLCFQASPQTREYAEDLKVTIHDEVDKHIGDILVPNCIYRGGCPELCSPEKCHRYENLCKIDPRMKSPDILERYDAFNEYFYDHYKKSHCAEKE